MDFEPHARSHPIPAPVTFNSADGLRLSAQRLGPPSGQVLLAHGFGQTRQSWLGTQHQLAAAGYGTLAWDMRGHGESGRNLTSCPYQADQFVDDQLSACAQLGGRPVLVGASMGGLTGLLAQAHAAPYSALVLVDITPRWEASGMRRIHAFMSAFPDGFASYAEAAQAISGYLPHRPALKTPAQLAHLLRCDPDARLRWHWDPRLLHEFVTDSEHLQDQVSNAATRIDVPVLLISGGRSDLVSRRTIEHFLGLVRHATHVELPQATHMLAGDDNDSFSAALLTYLRAHFPPSAACLNARDRSAHGARTARLPAAPDYFSGVVP